LSGRNPRIGQNRKNKTAPEPLPELQRGTVSCDIPDFVAHRARPRLQRDARAEGRASRNLEV
jgi:hypothetical protein